MPAGQNVTVAPGTDLANNPSTLAPGSLGSSDLSDLLSGLGTGPNLTSNDLAVASPSFSSITTPDVNVGGGATSNAGSATTDLGSSIGSILSSLGGGIANVLPYAGVYELLASQAASTQKQNNALAGQITNIGAPLVNEGQGLTKAFSGGTLTTPFQQQVKAAEDANANAATSQRQQVAQLLANSGGGQNVQGAEASESQQIQNAQNQANTQAIATAFQNELASGTSLVNVGGGYVQSGIEQEIQSNTQLQAQLSQLMGALAQAYARSGGLTGGSGGGIGGSFGNLISRLLGTGGGGGGGLNVGGLTSGLSDQLSAQGAALESQGDVAAGLDSASLTNAMNADTLGNLNAAAGNTFPTGTVSYGDFTMPDGSIVSSGGDLLNAASDSGGVASDIADFSAGSGSAAASTLAGAAGDVSGSVQGIANSIPAVDFGGASSGVPGLSAIAPGLSVFNAVENPTNPVADISAVGGVASLGGSAAAAAGDAGLSSALGALGSVAPYAALAAMAGELIVGSLTKPNNPDKINVPAAEAVGMKVDPYGKLPSGNSVLFDQSLGVGAGTQSSKGSGQIYQLSQDPANLKENAKDPALNAAYRWIGQSDTSALESDAHNLNSSLQSGQLRLNANGSYTATTPTAQRTLAGITSIFNSTGGEKGWGMSANEFIGTLHSLLSSGIYTSGDAFGSGN